MIPPHPDPERLKEIDARIVKTIQDIKGIAEAILGKEKYEELRRRYYVQRSQ